MKQITERRHPVAGVSMRLYGKPAYIRSDNGAEFTATAVMTWLRDQNVGPAYIKPGSPWQNGFVKNFNGKLRAEDNPSLPYQLTDRSGECRIRQRCSLEFIDSQIADILHRLMDGTIIVCADHGDCWGEDGYGSMD